MQKRGYIRIIGGKWRSRQIPVPATKTLRPTPDSVRETIFNWLSPIIVGSRCLDLFAGTGVLGLEALSRGAGYLVMIDNSNEVIIHLKSMIKQFDPDKIVLHQATLPAQLKVPHQSFNVIFLDPPYGKNLLLPCCYALEEKQCLSSPAYIYLEAEREILEQELPSNWQLLKSKKQGQVAYHLAKRL